MPLKLSPTIGYGCTALGSFVFVAGAVAQGVVAPPPMDFQVADPTLAATRTGQLHAGDLLGGTATPPPEPLLQLGPVNFRPNLTYRFLYGDGIPSRPGVNTTTAINEIYPGLVFELGPHWVLDYTPSFHLYSSSLFRDVMDQSVSLKGGTTYQDWTLGLSQSYDSTDQPMVETGTQTSTETYATALNLGYQFNQKLSLELGLNQNFRFLTQNLTASNLQDSRDWSSLDWLNYQVWPRLGLALGLGGGYIELGSQSAVASEQLQGRVTWKATDKLALVASGGGEDRQFLDGNQPSAITPIFGVSLMYQPFDVTAVSLDANRTISPAYFQSQMTTSTSITAHLHQRLLGKLSLDLTGGYRVTSYEATTSAASTSREDKGATWSVRLSAPFRNRGATALFYQASQQSSSFQGYTYSSTQVGLEISYRF